MRVKLYTMQHCPYCRELKEMLTAGEVEFTEVDCDLDENKSEFLELVDHTKSSDLPIVSVDQNILIPEVSFRSISEAYMLTKRILG